MLLEQTITTGLNREGFIGKMGPEIKQNGRGGQQACAPLREGRSRDQQGSRAQKV